MRRALKHIIVATTSLLAVTILCSTDIAAEEKPEDNSANSAAARSLETVLQKAGEQGFVAIEGAPTGTAKTRSKTKKNQSSKPLTEKPIVADCNVTAVMDLSIYRSVQSFEDIRLAKSGLEKFHTLEAVLPLAKTFIALGLGTETAELVSNFEGQGAGLLESWGRLIDGSPTQADTQKILQYGHCNGTTKFWALFAGIPSSPVDNPDASFELDRDTQKLLEDLPAQLQKEVILRLGIYAAEVKSIAVAERFLASLAPETKYGEIPLIKDDALLYYFALIQQNKGNPTAYPIFKHLAQYDGLYRSRALQKLAQENFQNGTALYDNFPDDLDAISQQYKGQSESRQATLQVVKHRLAADQFIDAIELSKREFSLIDPERAEAVSLLGDRLNMRLQDEGQGVRLYALNGYVHDPLFFSKYEQINDLKMQAQTTAVALNLPELVSVIEPEAQSLSEEQKKLMTYAKAQLAMKRGEYESAIGFAKSHKADPKFQALIMEAAIKSGNGKNAVDILRRIPAGEDRFKPQADLAWQKGNWGEARLALEALAHKAPDKALEDKIAITNYVGTESLVYVDRAVPDTAAEFDLLQTQLDSDIALVKGYLSNG